MHNWIYSPADEATACSDCGTLLPDFHFSCEAAELAVAA